MPYHLLLIILLLLAVEPARGQIPALHSDLFESPEVDVLELALQEQIALLSGEDSLLKEQAVERLNLLLNHTNGTNQQARLHYALGWFYLRLDVNYALAQRSFERAFDLAERTGQRRLMAAAMLQAMDMLIDMGLYDEALAYLFKTEQVFQKYNYEGFRSVTGSLFRIGQAFYRAGNHEQSIQYFEKALVFNDLHDDDYNVMHAYNSLGLSYLRTGAHQKAIEVFQISNQMAREMGDTGWEALTYGNIGMVYAELSDFDQAIAHLMFDITTSEKVEGWMSACNAAILLAEIYLKKSELAKASLYFELAQRFEAKEPSLYLKQSLHKLAATLFEQQGNFGKALTELQQFMELSKEIRLRSESVNKARQTRRAKYERQLVALDFEDQLNAAQGSIHQLNRVVLVLAGLFFLFFMAAVVFLRRERKIRHLQRIQFSRDLLKKELDALRRQLRLQLEQEVRAGPLSSWTDDLRQLMNEWNQEFYVRLKTSYPQLDTAEIHFLALLKLQFSAQEAAQLLGWADLIVAQTNLVKKLGNPVHPDQLSVWLSDV
jgi:tetratricopeptide (TPR) repeat protein